MACVKGHIANHIAACVLSIVREGKHLDTYAHRALERCASHHSFVGRVGAFPPGRAQGNPNHQISQDPFESKHLDLEFLLLGFSVNKKYRIYFERED